MNSEYQTPLQTLLNGRMCGSRGGIEGPHPGLLENQKFYGFLELAFRPPAPAPPPPWNRLDPPKPRKIIVLFEINH